MKVVLRLLLIMKPAWRKMLVGIIFSCLTIGCNIGLLAASGYLISSAALHPSITELSIAIVGVRFFGLSRAIFRYLERYLSHDATFSLLGSVRVWFYTKLERLAPAGLLTWRSGDLFSTIVGDVETLKEFYLRVLAPPIVAIILLISTSFLLFQYSMNFVYLLTIGFITAGCVLPFFIQTIQKSNAHELVVTKGELRAQIVDSMNGIVEVTAFDQGKDQAKEVETISEKLLGLQRSISKTSALIEALSLFIVNSTVWVLLYIAIPLVESGQLSGVLLAVGVLTVQSSFEAVLPLPLAMHYLKESIAAGKRLFAIIDKEPAVLEDHGITAIPATNIEVKNLYFKYKTQETFVLKDLNFSLRVGEKLAIVGPSGAGKSTLLHLLLRFWDYEHGSIQMGGEEFKSYHVQKLREKIGVVSQQTHLFNVSIRDNILLARPDASENDMKQAIKNSELEMFISELPEGENTQVGQNGYALSGGERQRVAIARALLKNAPLLILDEPTVGLDARTEKLVMKTIEKLMEGRSTIMITHRLTGLEAMDQIIAIESGCIVEKGTQAELLGNKGLFYQLWKLQHDVL